MNVKIDEAGQSLAHRLATKRHNSFSHDDFEDTAFGKSSFDVHLIGAKSEIAVSYYYDLLVDMKERLEGDEHDFVIEYDGEPATLDVKCTTYRPPWMQVRETKTGSDYYIATYMDGPESNSVELVGWSDRPTLIEGDRIQSPAGGNHLNYRLWKDEMEEIPEPGEVVAAGPTVLA